MNALVVTGHLHKCKRVGGFHSFIRFLAHFGYDVDWLTIPIQYRMLIRNNDRDNKENFFALIKGVNLEERTLKTGKVTNIRNFGIPSLLPIKVEWFLYDKLHIRDFIFRRFKKKLKNKYEVIFLEGVAIQYAEALRKSYPQAKIIYRVSDIPAAVSNEKYAEIISRIENDQFRVSDLVLVVDENMKEYYEKRFGKTNKIRILRNPLTTKEEYEDLKEKKIKQRDIKSAVFVGANNLDWEVICYAAENNKDVEFKIIGPYEKYKEQLTKYKNIHLLGSMTPDQFTPILNEAALGFDCWGKNNFAITYNIKGGYTKKIILYMRSLLPIVVKGGNNYMNCLGYISGDDKQGFSDGIRQVADFTQQEREELRTDYLRIMSNFISENVEQDLLGYLRGLGCPVEL